MTARPGAGDTAKDARGAGAPEGVERIPVDLGPGVRAFFTTARGGVSPGPWASDEGPGLNLGLNVSDDADRVRTNRSRVAAVLGGDPVAFATQVHADRVITLGPADRDRWSARQGPDTAGEGDGLVTDVPGFGLGVLVADCLPVVLADPVARVVAVAHAGRKGVAAGVVFRVLESMVARGASTSRVRAVVGPAVCGRCYEVPDALRDEVAAVVPDAYTTTSWGTPGLDLPAAVVGQLVGSGAHATHLGRCTLEDAAFYSHRRAVARGATTGRQAGVVALEGP